MKKFRVRLSVTFIVLIGLSVLLAGLFTAQLVKKSYIGELEENMHREIGIILASSDWTKTGDESAMIRYYSEKVQNLKEIADARITYIRKDGKVLGDSDHDPATMDNHLDRKEIQEAASKQKGRSIRYSDTLGQNMLYVAEPVLSGGQAVGFIRLAMSLENVEAFVSRIWLFLLLGLGLLFAASSWASYRIARNLTRPLEDMTKVARQISDLNYDARVDIHSKDEIGQLSLAINTMADSLQSQMDRILENETRLKSVLDNMMSGVLMIDRTETIMLLNRSAEELLGFSGDELLGKNYRVANQQFEFAELIGECIRDQERIRDEFVFYFPEERILEVNASPLYDSDEDFAGVLVVLHNVTAFRRLERMRSEFVANVSHELKTPVAAVKGFAETLLNGAMNDMETARTFLKIIFDESERLNRLIGDILELSKIESKRVPLQYSPVEMKDFISQSLQMVKDQAARKKITLEMDAEEGQFIEADEDRLRQIIINLLSNGIAYTPEGGRVKVILEPVPGDGKEENERIRLIIADTGIGIPKQDLPRIFERFYRVDKARSRISGGTGLGLSIVKHLVDLHRGTISVESTVGMGSRFIVELPVIH